MNILDTFVYSYSKLHNYNFIPFWILTPFRKALRYLADLILPHSLKYSKRQEPLKKTDVIVSLTSFPARINEVWQVIECILRQTYIPSKIILWLSEEQFPNKDHLPKSLLNLEGDIFSIRFVAEDIRSHKKYYYVSKEYPDSNILLIDDDIYYPTDMIEKLLMLYNNNIVCRYAYQIKYNNEGKISPYEQWDSLYSKSIDTNLFFGSGGGTLFSPRVLYKDLLDKELFMKLCPYADDVWLNAMSRLNQVGCVKANFGLILPVNNGRENQTLSSTNVSEGYNDIQIGNVCRHYINNHNVNPFSNTYCSKFDSSLIELK